MPTYDYKCDTCAHMFEHFQSMHEAPLESCPQCGSKVRRLLGGGAGIIFKGSGFYVTDNRKDKPSGESKPSENTKQKTAEPAAT